MGSNHKIGLVEEISEYFRKFPEISYLKKVSGNFTTGRKFLEISGNFRKFPEISYRKKISGNFTSLLSTLEITIIYLISDTPPLFIATVARNCGARQKLIGYLAKSGRRCHRFGAGEIGTMYPFIGPVNQIDRQSSQTDCC